MNSFTIFQLYFIYLALSKLTITFGQNTSRSFCVTLNLKYCQDDLAIGFFFFALVLLVHIALKKTCANGSIVRNHITLITVVQTTEEDGLKCDFMELCTFDLHDLEI